MRHHVEANDATKDGQNTPYGDLTPAEKTAFRLDGTRMTKDDTFTILRPLRKAVDREGVAAPEPRRRVGTFVNRNMSPRARRPGSTASTRLQCRQLICRICCRCIKTYVRLRTFCAQIVHQWRRCLLCRVVDAMGAAEI